MPKRAGAFALVCRADCLGGIFDQKNIATSGNRKHRVQVRHLAKQMDRENGPGAWGDDGFDPGRVQIIGQGVNIDKDRSGSETGNTPD